MPIQTIPFQEKIVAGGQTTYKSKVVENKFGHGYVQSYPMGHIKPSATIAITFAPLTNLEAETLNTFLFSHSAHTAFQITLPNSVLPIQARVRKNSYQAKRISKKAHSITITIVEHKSI